MNRLDCRSPILQFNLSDDEQMIYDADELDSDRSNNLPNNPVEKRPVTPIEKRVEEASQSAIQELSFATPPHKVIKEIECPSKPEKGSGAVYPKVVGFFTSDSKSGGSPKAG